MFTVKHITNQGIEITSAKFVSIVTERNGKDELDRHKEDLNKRCEIIGQNVNHDNLRAVVMGGGSTLYPVDGDACYVVNEHGKTVHSMDFR